LYRNFYLNYPLAGCGSSKKQLEKGNYDAAIQKAVKDLRKDPKDTKQIDILNQAYKIANEQDNERVRMLKMEGKPNSWDEIYLVYKALTTGSAGKNTAAFEYEREIQSNFLM